MKKTIFLQLILTVCILSISSSYAANIGEISQASDIGYRIAGNMLCKFEKIDTQEIYQQASNMGESIYEESVQISSEDGKTLYFKTYSDGSYLKWTHGKLSSVSEQEYDSVQEKKQFSKDEVKQIILEVFREELLNKPSSREHINLDEDSIYTHANYFGDTYNTDFAIEIEFPAKMTGSRGLLTPSGYVYESSNPVYTSQGRLSFLNDIQVFGVSVLNYDCHKVFSEKNIVSFENTMDTFIIKNFQNGDGETKITQILERIKQLDTVNLSEKNKFLVEFIRKKILNYKGGAKDYDSIFAGYSF